MKKPDILEFAKKHLCFKLHPYQEEFLKMNNPKLIWWPRNPYKKYFSNYITSEHLSKMKIGQTFGLATKEGISVFKRIKIKSKSKIKVQENSLK